MAGLTAQNTLDEAYQPSGTSSLISPTDAFQLLLSHPNLLSEDRSDVSLFSKSAIILEKFWLLTESQMWGWKGPLKSCPTALAHAGLPRAGCPGARPAGF